MEVTMEKILLLEDDAALGAGIGMALQTPQMAVVLCHTLEEARRELAQEVFSLLILDINLPDGSIHWRRPEGSWRRRSSAC